MHSPSSLPAGFKALESELAAEAEAEDAVAPPDIPTKVVSANIQVTLRARVLCFDFDGRSGERAGGARWWDGRVGGGGVWRGGQHDNSMLAQPTA